MRLILPVLISIFFFCCACNRHLYAPKKTIQELEDLVVKSPTFLQHFTGFLLYDPAIKTTITQQNAHKYFTPASNTKIWTLYSALTLLGDELPVLRYQQSGDTLYIQGTGYPLFLHPEVVDESKIRSMLSKASYIYFSKANFGDERYGPGWAWDDYGYGWQPEKHPFPIYENVVAIEKDSVSNQIEVYPSFFKDSIFLNDLDRSKKVKVTTKEYSNIFTYNRAMTESYHYKRKLPFTFKDSIWAKLLTDTLNIPVQITEEWDTTRATFTLTTPTKDTLYRRLMEDSDNFIAEQLLLMCSDKLLGYQKTSDVIPFIKDSLLMESPDVLLWRDGSGLSRYNLITPSSMVWILEKLWNEYPKERILSIFPKGGEGTISNWYKGEDNPYVYAKTGTLSNRHCLSGYLHTRSGKYLIFSFMHNNYRGGSGPVKEEMEKVLAWIRDNF